MAFKATTIFSIWMFRALIFSVWAFKATIFSQFWRSEPPPSSQFGRSVPPSLLSFDVQSHHRFLITTFRVVFLSLTFKDVSPQLWCSDPSSSLVWRSKLHLQLGVQSHRLRFGVQSHRSFMEFRVIIFFNLAFRALTSFWHLEPCL